MAGCACAHHRAFTAGCRACQRLDAAYNRRRQRAIKAGTWQHRVPVDQIRSHLTALRADGMSLRAIATAAKLSHRTVIAITSRRHVQGPTAAAVLAVTPTHALPAGMVDATGTTRRIRALVALGYPLSHIAAHLDRHLQQVWEWAWAKQATVTTTTAATVAACYEQLRDTTPPPGRATSRARNLAHRNQWAPPLDWDDDDIDNPQAAPMHDTPDPDHVDRVLVSRVLAGHTPATALTPALTPAERVAAVHAGRAGGMSDSAIAALLHASTVTIRTLAAQRRSEHVHQ